MEEITKAMETVKKNKQRRAEERAERNRQALEVRQHATITTCATAACARVEVACSRWILLQHGKDVEAVVVMKVTQHLEERAQRRKETYDKWTENVFDPINNAVQSAVNTRVRCKQPRLPVPWLCVPQPDSQPTRCASDCGGN